MAKQVIREYKTEVKITKSIYASDFAFLAGFVIVAYLVGTKLVNTRFMLPFILFSVVAGLVLLRKSRQNPRIKVWQELSRMAKREHIIYKPFYADEFIEEVTHEKK